MKKKITWITLFVFGMILGAAFVGNVSAQTKRNFSYGNNFTVNYASAVSTSVVINEVYGGSEAGGVYNADFIELYNLSAVPVNISDYSVQYYTAGQINAGAPTSTAHIPDATILQAFSYYVIRVSPDNRAGLPIPCDALNASASFAETGIDPDGGKLVLSSTGADIDACTSTLNVMDRVGYGITPVVCNETSNAGQPSVSTTVQRLMNAADTDNNSVDFTASNAPTPCSGQMAPTAATVTIGGRATTSTGRGIRSVVISMIDSSGVIRTAMTTSFGFYKFSDVAVGTNYIITAKGKRFTFTQPTQVKNINEDDYEINFISYGTDFSENSHSNLEFK